MSNQSQNSTISSINDPKLKAHAIDVHVGKRLRQIRRNNSESQTQLADVLGLTFQQLQKYERGTNRISAGALFLVCEHYKISPNWLFEGLSINDDTDTGFSKLKKDTLTLVELSSPKTIKAINALLAS